MELFEAISGRYSYRGEYLPAPVPREELKRIMQAGLDAPSGCNRQTTRLIGVDDPTMLKRFADMLEMPKLATAPAGICVLTKRIIAYRSYTFYKQDYAAAVENMLLAAAALGYDSCWIEGHITAEDNIGRQMADLYGVPEDWELVVYLPIGKAAAEGPRVKKLPFEDRAWFNEYNGEN